MENKIQHDIVRIEVGGNSKTGNNGKTGKSGVV